MNCVLFDMVSQVILIMDFIEKMLLGQTTSII
ncbi:hypothetical protein AXFE_07460 [Acidithrix ferrooxidans]|uniref:Uncharacterized protein n=1 Tax=Acidithrix ferrooxidans TaxID=1280514 RepID=A0A0D8HKB9_9ACTN|nr:hypothetical protein AXFE_07460 [Acidithrix ferrooxidans]